MFDPGRTAPINTIPPVQYPYCKWYLAKKEKKKVERSNQNQNKEHAFEAQYAKFSTSNHMAKKAIAVTIA